MFIEAARNTLPALGPLKLDHRRTAGRDGCGAKRTPLAIIEPEASSGITFDSIAVLARSKTESVAFDMDPRFVNSKPFRFIVEESDT
jgi:hypothetical protein